MARPRKEPTQTEWTTESGYTVRLVNDWYWVYAGLSLLGRYTKLEEALDVGVKV